MMSVLRKTLIETLRSLSEFPVEQLLANRRQRLLSYGKFKESATA